jgi:hypothetical protein
MENEMRKILVAVAMVPLLALGACGKSEECTPELAQKKTEELTKTIQEIVTKDPTKGAAALTKMQEMTTKYANADEKEACKAIDELLASIKE